MSVRKAIATYKGIPRDEIDWFPTVDLAKCSRCKICTDNCPHNTYDWKDKPIVARPYNCVVGCMGCANNCPEDAITFPTLVWLRDELVRLRKKYPEVRL
jgi:NAD-dependent dihydropyrimidine dehydrogenase PreA subunit